MSETLLTIRIHGSPMSLESARKWLRRHFISPKSLVGIELLNARITEQNPLVQADNGTRHEAGRLITDTVLRLDGNGNNANSNQDHATFCIGHDEMGCITERRPI